MKLLLSLACLLLLTITASAGFSNTPPADKGDDFTCLNAEINSLKVAAAATVQSQADLALSQADAFHRLNELHQSC